MYLRLGYQYRLETGLPGRASDQPSRSGLGPRRFLQRDALRQAIIAVANATFAVRQAHIWGESTTACVSDAKKFAAWDQNLLTEWHARYGYPLATLVNGFPLAARPQHIPNPIQRSPVIRSWTTWPPSFWYRGQQLFDHRPQLIRHFEIIDIFRFCATIFTQDVSSLDLVFGKPIFHQEHLFFKSLPFYG